MQPHRRVVFAPAQEGLRWQVLPLAGADLGEHSECWDLICERLSPGHPMLSATFVNSLLHHHPEPHLHLAQLFDGSELIGLLLLCSRPGSGLWRSYLPMNAQIGLCLLPTEAPLERLMPALPGHAARLDLLCNDPDYGDQRGLALPLRRVQPHALTMHIDLRAGVDAYWQSRSRKLLSNLRRYEKRAQQQGEPLEMRCVREAAELPAALDRYAGLEQSDWKGAAGTALTPGSPQACFYGELLTASATRGEARCYELWSGERLVASRLLLVRAGMAVMLKTAYLESEDQMAPGRLLLKRVIDALGAEGDCERIEFYTDANADLLGWASGQRWISHVEVYRHRLALLGVRTLGRIKRRGAARPQSDARIAVERLVPSQLPEDVRQFMAPAESRHLELGAPWFELLSRSVYPSDDSVALYVLRHGGRPVAVLPVRREQRQLQSLSNYYSAYFEPILAPGIRTGHELKPLLQALRRDAGSIGEYRFGPMDPAHPSFLVLSQALRLAGLQPSPYFCFGNWYLEVRDDWASYLKERSGQLRSTIKRMGKRLTEQGGRLEVFEGKGDLAPYIAAYEQVYAASWKDKEPYPQFVRGLIELCAERGSLSLGLAWLGERPIAAQLWFVNGKRACIYKVAYDESFKALAPGTSVTALLMQHVMDQDKVTEVDYLIGDDPYKQTWMSHRRERWGLVAYNTRSWRGLLLWLRKRLADAAKTRLPRRWLNRLRGSQFKQTVIQDASS